MPVAQSTFAFPSIFRRWGAAFMLIMVGVLLALLLLEGLVRLFLPPARPMFDTYGDSYVCSDVTGWLGRPNYQGLLTREEYSHPVRFNSAGMYDTEHPPAKPDDLFRVLWVGDSFAQAWQVAEPDTAHQQLETLLDERLGGPDRRFEVISAGVMGWGTGQELLHYRHWGRRYQPDLVLLLFFMGNDVNDNLPGHALTIDGYNCFAPYFPLCGSGLDPRPWPHVPGLAPAWGSCSPLRRTAATGLSLLQRNSYLWARIEPLLLAQFPRRTYGQAFGLPFAALYLPEESPEVRYGWQVTEGLLAQFRQEVEADGAEFGVAIVGPREVVWLSQLTPEQRQSFYQSDPAFRESDIAYPNRRLASFLQSQDIPVLDLQQPMVDHIAQTGSQIYLPIDRHWTEAGNRLAAELIFNWIVENGWVTP